MAASNRIAGELSKGDSPVTKADGRVTFRAAADAWRSQVRHRDSTKRSVTSAVSMMNEEFGDTFLSAFTPAMIRKWELAQLARLAPGTCEVRFSYLRGIFAHAVELGQLRVSPAAKLHKPKKEAPHEVVPFSRAEVGRAVKVAPAHLKAMIMVCAGLGTRISECFGITADRIDFEAGTVRIDRQLTNQRVCKTAEFGKPKTYAGTRTVKLTPDVTKALREHMAQFPLGDQGLVFTSTGGTCWTRAAWGEQWRKVRERAELPTERTAHDLRHFAVTEQIGAGVPIQNVAAYAGHTVQECLKTYTHFLRDREDGAVAAMTSALAGVWASADESVQAA